MQVFGWKQKMYRNCLPTCTFILSEVLMSKVSEEVQRRQRLISSQREAGRSTRLLSFPLLKHSNRKFVLRAEQMWTSVN